MKIDDISPISMEFCIEQLLRFIATPDFKEVVKMAELKLF